MATLKQVSGKKMEGALKGPVILFCWMGQEPLRTRHTNDTWKSKVLYDQGVAAQKKAVVEERKPYKERDADSIRKYFLEAADCFEKAIPLNGDNSKYLASLYFDLGRVRVGLGQNYKDKTERTAAELAKAEQAEAKRAEAELVKAVLAFDSAIKINPKCPHNYLWRGKARVRICDMIKKQGKGGENEIRRIARLAIDDFTRAMEHGCEKTFLSYELGQAHMMVGNMDEAEKWLKFAQDNLPKEKRVKKAKVCFLRGTLASIRKDPDCALDCLNMAKSLGYDNAQLYLEIGGAHLQRREYADALNNLRIAESRGFSGWFLYSGKAQTLSGLGEYESALEENGKAISLNPGRAVLHQERGRILLRLEKYAEAKKAYDDGYGDRIARGLVGNGIILEYAEILYRLREPAEACKLFEAAMANGAVLTGKFRRLHHEASRLSPA
ncbi:MAG: hypothetical protein NT051_04920 [Candidatus Micrarchaeota archaeon]|nr:hypothetical protein [Candidatus Micrarchaeota archaeon]